MPALNLLSSELQTRFEPVVCDPVDVLFASIGNTSSPGAHDWPLPPQALRAAHDAQFVQAVWQSVDALLSQPTSEVTLRGGARAVQVLGAAVFLLGKSGQIHVFLWENENSLELASYRTVMVTEIPYGNIWLRRLVSLGLHRRCDLPQARGIAAQKYNEAYVDWLVKVLLRRIRKQHDLRAVRHRIAVALGIDPDIWRLCHRLHIASPLDHKASIKQYNLCVRHQAELLEVEAVAPRALGIYALLCERLDFPCTGEPTQRLRKYLRSQGLSSRVWRLVLRNGSRLLLLIRQFYSPCGGDAVLDCLKVMDGLGVFLVPPAWLSQALFAEWGNAGARRSSYLDRMASSMPNLKHLVSCAVIEFQCRPDDAQEEQIAEVVHWVTEPQTRVLTRTQRQGGWAYLAREARNFHRQREEIAAAHRIAWDTPFESLDAGNVRLVAVANSLQLLEEGRRMRNCAASWQDRCAEGMDLLVSAREPDGRRLATVSYEWLGDAWRFGDAKGPMNRTLGSRLMQRLQRAAALVPAPVISVCSLGNGEADESQDAVAKLVNLFGYSR
jgi:hypothetical protein